MMRFRLPSLLLVLSLMTGVAHAQEPIHLTLQRAVDVALKDGPQAQIDRLSFEQSEWDYQAFSAGFRPSLSLRGSAPGLLRSIADVQQDDGSIRYVPQSRTSSSVDLAIDQPIPFTGGQISFSSGLSRVDQFGDISFSQWQSSPLAIQLTQPLFGFNAMKWDRKIEPLQFASSQRAYAEAHEEAALEVVSRFFDLYLEQKNVETARFNVAVNDTIYTLSQGRYQLGTIAENDLLQSELALLNARTQLSNAQIAYDRALQSFKLYLGIPFDTPIDIIPPADAPVFEVDPARAVTKARQNRAAFLDLEVQSLQAGRGVAQARRNGSFSADLTARFGLNQTAGTLDGVYANPLNQQRFSVGFQVPLWQWGRNKAQLESAIAQREQTQRQVALQREELERDVYFEALQFRQMQQQVAIGAKADTVAARRFEVARNRFLIGKIDNTELFNAQREKDNAREAYVRILRQYWTAYYRLRRLTLFDFEKNQPLPVN